MNTLTHKLPIYLSPFHNENSIFTLLSFEGEKMMNCQGQSYTRYLFHIVDHADGQIKFLSLGKSVARDLMGKMTLEKPKLKRHWFVQCLERFKLVKPLPTEHYKEFRIHRRWPPNKPYPSYSVQVLR